MHAREILNRTRIWLNCYNVDRSMSSQYGKNTMVNNLDYVATHSEFFYKRPYTIPGFDVHLCGYNAELKILADYRLTIFSDPEHPVGLNKVGEIVAEPLTACLLLNQKLDVTAEAMKTDDKLEKLWDTWRERIREENCQELYSQFRTSLLKLAMSYARMAVLSFAFVHVYGRDAAGRPNDAFFWRVRFLSYELVHLLANVYSLVL